jgi:DNA-binding CsgD family transcriptional regulator
MRPLQFFVLYVFSVLIFAQEHPVVMSFTPENYAAENQNWDITQTDNQFMYFANNSGLLEFNGSKWTLYPVPDNHINNSIVRSVKAIGNKVYSGSYMDFGVWEKNKHGVLAYESIPDRLEINIKQEEQFWNIEVIDNSILFQSLSRIYLINLINNEVKIIESNEEIWNTFYIDGAVYIAKKNKGVYKIVNGEVVLLSAAPELLSSKLVGISKFNDKHMFITRNNGILYFEDGILKEWQLSSELDLSKLAIYSSLQLKDSSLILGTISNGIIHVRPDGSLKYKIDFEKGLTNNTILSLFQDQKNNLWLGLDIGISHISLSSKFRVYKDATGQIGTVYASVVHKDNLYLGTNQGLFVKPRGFDGSFDFIAGTSGQVWTLKVIDDLLFCGHNKGTFIIENKNIKSEIFDADGSWEFKKIKNTDLILQGNYEGLNVLKKSSAHWEYSHKIDGFDISSRFFQIIDSTVYVNHEISGLYKLDVTKDFKTLKKYTAVSNVPTGSGSNVINFLGDFYYTSSKGVFRLDQSTGEFQEASNFQGIFDEYISTTLSSTTLLDINSTQQMKWCFAGNNILLISPGSLSNKPKIEQIPIVYSNFRNVVVGFENLTRISDNEFLLGSSNGYFVLRSDLPKIDYRQKIEINLVMANPKNQIKAALDLTTDALLNYKNNNLYFEYSVPQYGNIVETNYSYKLEGWSQAWSSWSSATSQIFENLPSGNYIFKVKGKVGNTETINEASFEVVIQRPWFLSIPAITIYIILLLIVSVLIHNIYKRYYKNQQKALLLKSQKEMALNELENSQKLMQLKNEKLEIAIDSKNRELAISTMSLIKKNEFLNTIKKAIQEQGTSNGIRKVIKIIDNNLNNTDDWKLFKEAFDNADKDFLKLVKEKHPNLTPNDLKLCAYLRLNLASKEIAPLLNISPRSVEVKRYRLRKKMNLAPKSSLTNYILEL